MAASMPVAHRVLREAVDDWLPPLLPDAGLMVGVVVETTPPKDGTKGTFKHLYHLLQNF